MFERIKNFFGKKNIQLSEAERRERERKLREINHPDDNFNDDYMDEDEMRRLSDKASKKRNFRTWYYVFGFIFAAILMGIALVNYIKAKDFDLSIMVQNDGFITEAEIKEIEELVKPLVPDRNGDGEIKLKVVQVSLPIEETEVNSGTYQYAINDMEKELTPNYIVLLFGREGFIKEASEFRNMDETVALKEVEGLNIKEGSALEEYKMAVREIKMKSDKYGPIGLDIYEELAK